MLSSGVLRIVCAVAFAVLVGCVAPVPAFGAASVDAASVRTVAQVQTDGALHEVEQRTFVFDESRSALRWPVTSMEADSELEVQSVRFAHCTLQGGIDGEWTSLTSAPFTSEIREVIEQTSGLSANMDARGAASSDSEGGSTGADPIPSVPSFCVDSRGRSVYLFFPPTEGRVVFECDLTVSDAVRVFDDAAELYWDYVPADADAGASSVSVTVQLPMPTGMEAVAGENVFAWGHGAAGTVDVKPDGTVAFRVPELTRGQYAQAHMLFPQQWLTNLSAEALRAHSGTRLDDARAEEEAWTDTWSAWLSNSLWIDLAFVIASLLVLGAALALFFAFGREPKPDAGQTAPSLCKEYEAPLIRRLLRWDHASNADFVALIMQLAARQAIKIEVLPDAGPLGTGYNDLRFRSGTRAKQIARSPLDQEALRLLFDVWGEGYASVTLTDIAHHAAASKERFRQELAGFEHVLTDDMRAQGFFDARSARVQRGILIAGCILCVGTLLFGVLGGSFVRGTALIVAGIGCLFIGNYTACRTRHGARIEASALALADKLEHALALEDIADEDAPYAFVLDVMPQADAPAHGGSTAHTPSCATLWLAPRTGRGGKPVPSLAAQLARTLKEWG